MRKCVRWCLGLCLVPAIIAGAPAQDEVTRARRIHAQAIGVDGHIDTLQRALIENADIGSRLPDGHVDLIRLKEGGIRAPFFSLWVPAYYKGAEAIRRTLGMIDALQRALDAHPQLIEKATTVADIERIGKSGRVAAILALEGGHQIDDDLAVLRVYHHLGVRSMTLTHFRNNNWADASTDQPKHNGLTAFGKQVVREMNRLGILVDVSHVSDRTFYDAIDASTKPVIASHSSCRAISNVPRNLDDDMLRALARNGGVVGINFAAGFLNPSAAEAAKKSIASMTEREPDLTGRELDDYAAKRHLADFRTPRQGPTATLEDVVAHIDHAVKIAGIDHVGIGSDYDGISSAPIGLEDVSKMPALSAALLSKGYSEKDVKKILGDNFLRVMRKVFSP